MDIKEQVCSLELAEKLKRLGVKQDSLWYWAYNGRMLISESERNVYVGDDIYAAFTVAELGARLPSELKHQGEWYFFVERKLSDGKWVSWYQDRPDNTKILKTTGFGNAEERTKQVIRLVLNGYITEVDWLEGSD